MRNKLFYVALLTVGALLLNSTGCGEDWIVPEAPDAGSPSCSSAALHTDGGEVSQ